MNLESLITKSIHKKFTKTQIFNYYKFRKN